MFLDQVVYLLKKIIPKKNQDYDFHVMSLRDTKFCKAKCAEGRTVYPLLDKVAYYSSF